MTSIATLLLIIFVSKASSRSFWFEGDVQYETPDPDIKFKTVKEQPYTLPKADANLNIYAIPVGQGDSTVIQCPSASTSGGGKITVIDAGSSGNRGFTKADFLTYLGGQTIEKVILTHPDADHVNYIEDLLTKITPPSSIPPVYHSCDWTDYSAYINDPDIDKKESQILSCCGKTGVNGWRKCPNFFACNRKVTLSVLGSEIIDCATSKNGASVITQVKYGGERVALISGDFEGPKSDIDEFIECAGELESSIYKLAHHGSHGSDNREDLLDEVIPSYAFSSSGLRYNHPRCEVLDDLSAWLNPAPSHAYSCFRGGVLDKKPTKEAIWTTTTENAAGNYVNDVIQFAVTTAGAVTVKVINVD